MATLKNSVLPFLILLLSSNLVPFLGTATAQESFIKSADVADAIESNFSLIDNHLVRWSVEYHGTKLENVFSKKMFSALKKSKNLYENRWTEDQKKDFEKQLLSYKIRAGDAPKERIYRAQLLVSGDNLQCYLSPVCSNEEREIVKRQVFPDKLVTEEFLAENWQGGLIYSLYNPPNSLLLRQLNSPLELRRETNRGRAFRYVFEFCAPFFLPGRPRDEFDMRWCVEQLSTNLRPGSFVESLRENGWKVKELESGLISIERRKEIEFFNGMGQAVESKAENESLKFKSIVEYILDPEYSFMPIMKSRWGSNTANGKKIIFEIDPGLMKWMQEKGVEIRKGFYPVQIAKMKYERFGNICMLKELDAVNLAMLFKDSEDPDAFPVDPRFSKSPYAILSTIFLDHSPTTKFQVGIAGRWKMHTEKFIELPEELEAKDFEFKYGDLKIIDKSSISKMVDRNEKFKGLLEQNVEEKKQGTDFSIYGPFLFLGLLVLGATIFAMSKKHRNGIEKNSHE